MPFKGTFLSMCGFTKQVKYHPVSTTPAGSEKKNSDYSD